MPTQNQISFLLDTYLYKQDLVFTDLSSILNQLLQSGVKEFRIKMFLNEDNIFEKIKEGNKNNVRIKIIHKNDVVRALELDGEYGRKNIQKIVGKVLIIKHPVYKKVWMAITDEPNEFIKRPLKYFLRSIHPRSTAVILTTPQMEELLLSFQKDLGSQVRVKQIGQRAKIKSLGATKSIESDRRWTDLNINEAFSEAKEAGQWLTDITLEYGPENSGSLLKVGRYGEFLFQGPSKVSIDHFVNLAAKYGEYRFNFLNNREKNRSNNFTSTPFYINFNYPVFKEKEQYDKLAQALKKIPSSSFTKLHGNPYFHATMVDYKDGSNYEVMIMNTKYLTVIPQGRSTVRALQRLCSSIFSNFREGEIVGTINEE